MSFELYADHPWEAVSGTVQRDNYYDPVMANVYMRDAVYSQYVSINMNLAAVPTNEYTVTDIIPPRPTPATVDNRAMWTNSQNFDTFSRSIGFAHRMGKLAFHKFDAMMFYLRQQGGGLAAIVERHMSPMIVDTLDINSRDAFLTHPHPAYQRTGAGAKFAGIQAGDKFGSEVMHGIWERMSYRSMPWNQLPNPEAPTGLVCITSPGVVADLRKEVNATEGKGWIDIMKRADPSRLLRLQVGQYLDTTFIATPMAVLWNCGTVIARGNIVAPVGPLDGAPNPNVAKVHGTYRMGQANAAGQKHYIQLNTGGTAGFLKGDKVTLHRWTTDEFGVTGPEGVDYRDPDIVNTIVVDVDAVNHRLVVERPVQVEYDVDLGSGVFGYVTKALHVHSATFIGSNAGVRRAVAQAPTIHFPPTIDDGMAMKRITWDGYYGEQVFQPEAFEVWFGDGSYQEWASF